MPLLFVLLVSWYFVYRLGGALTSRVARLSARAADRVADTAGRLGRHGDRLREQATAAAARLRTQADTADRPRTRAGQRHEETRTCGPTTSGPAGASGPSPAWEWAADTARSTGSALGGLLSGLVSGLLGWARLAWVDAVAAAESAQARRAQDQPAWWQWPSGDDPQAPLPPVQATAERTDRRPDTPPQPAPVPTPGPTASTSVPWPGWMPITPPPPPGSSRLGPTAVIWAPTRAAIPAPVVRMTAHRTDRPADQPQPHELPAAPTRLAITDGRNKTMETAAETGLGEYLRYTEAMNSTCQQGVTSVETTLSALENQDWSGVPIDALREAMDLLGQVRDKFSDAHEAFRASQAVKDAYTSNDHTGTKDSVLSD